MLEIGCGTGQADVAPRRARLLDPRSRAGREPRGASHAASSPLSRMSRSSRPPSRTGIREASSSTPSSPSTRFTGSTLTSASRRRRPCCGRRGSLVRVRLRLRRPRRGGSGVARGRRGRSGHRRLRAASPRRLARPLGRVHGGRVLRRPSREGRTSGISVRRRRLRRALGVDVDISCARGRCATGAVRASRAPDRASGGTVRPTRVDVLYVATTA